MAVNMTKEQNFFKELEKYPKFREERFHKFYSFFSRYFTESGSNGLPTVKWNLLTEPG